MTGAITGSLRARLLELGVNVTIVSKNIGYELRCADPVPSDMEYTRDLGYCAARYIIEGGTHALVSMQAGRFKPIPFHDIMDPTTGRMRVRMVDLASDRYRIARTYMIRLKRSDLHDAAEMQRMAQVIGKTADEFRAEFGHVFDADLEPIRALTPPPPPVR